MALELVNPFVNPLRGLTVGDAAGAVGGYFAVRGATSIVESLLGRWEMSRNLLAKLPGAFAGMFTSVASFALLRSAAGIGPLSILGSPNVNAGMMAGAFQGVVGPVLSMVAPNSLFVQRLTGITAMSPGDVSGYTRTDSGGKFASLPNPVGAAFYKRTAGLGNSLGNRQRTAVVSSAGM